MKWEKRGSAESIEEAIRNLSGLSKQELVSPNKASPSGISGIAEAGALLLQATKNGTPITVVGDYDADGICSVAEMYLLITRLGAVPRIRIPKRISEGYGISPNIVDEIDDGLLVTVDNGITANEAMSDAKAKGLSVIIIDHHLPGDAIPEADVIVNPHVEPEKNEFVPYCGAGLVFKLAQHILDDEELLEKMQALAAIATVADVVPLIGDNRAIVMGGLKALNARKVTQGLASVLDACEFTVIKASDIGYRLAPILNAMGRLVDDGARVPCACLAQDEKETPQTAAKLIAANEERKALVEESYKAVKASITDSSAPIIACVEGLHEGVVGIIAGKLADEYQMPAFVFSGDGESYKGSGRSFGGVNLKEFVDSISEHTTKCGGHAGAVGLSVDYGQMNAFVSAAKEGLAGYVVDEGSVCYDLAIDSGDVVAGIRELSEYAPFGEGCPELAFMVSGVELMESYGSFVKYMGKNEEHVRFTSLGYSLVGFGLAAKYRELGEPRKVDVVGYLEMNDSKYGSKPQVRIIDIRTAQQKER